MQPQHALIVEVMRRRARAAAVGCAASTVHQACEALVPLAIGLTIEYAVDRSRPAGILLAIAGVLVLFTVLAAGGESLTGS